MYLLPHQKKSDGYFPQNTKWGGTSALSGLLPGGGLRGYRPNQAMDRGFIPGLSGDPVSVDPAPLVVGIGLLAVGMFLFGSKHGPKIRKRKAARLRRQLAALEG
jgi:hypothetical protein